MEKCELRLASISIVCGVRFKQIKTYSLLRKLIALWSVENQLKGSKKNFRLTIRPAFLMEQRT